MMRDSTSKSADSAAGADAPARDLAIIFSQPSAEDGDHRSGRMSKSS
jgi:hypothetical protein